MKLVFNIVNMVSSINISVNYPVVATGAALIYAGAIAASSVAGPAALVPVAGPVGAGIAGPLAFGALGLLGIGK